MKWRWWLSKVPLLFLIAMLGWIAGRTYGVLFRGAQVSFRQSWPEITGLVVGAAADVALIIILGIQEYRRAHR